MKHSLLSLLIIFFLFSVSNSQTIMLDDFETGVGHFNFHTTYSGSTVGLLSTIPTIDTTTAAFGSKSLKIVLVDNPESSVDWACRFLSGGGAPESNTAMAPSGWTGYWLKTNRPWVRTAPALDAPGTAEIGDTTDVIGDSQWHLYQWNLGADGKPHWNGWVTGNDTISDDATPTYDAIWFFAPDGSDTTVIYLDAVSWNQTAELPVELVSFNALSNNNVVDLKWITATEVNNRGFEVERRTENTPYRVIAFIQGKGTTTQVSGYSYSDEVSQAETYYYRLKQVDYDGRYNYSNEVMVSIVAMPGQYALAQNYPNPFNPSTSIEFVIPDAGHTNLAIFNLLGQRVAELVNEIKEAGTHSVTFNAGNLASGTYIYTLRINGNTITKKMNLIK